MENSKIIDNIFESYAYDDIALNLPFAESPFDRPVINTC